MNYKKQLVSLISALITVSLALCVVLYIMFIADGIIIEIPLKFHLVFIVLIILYFTIAKPHYFES